VAVPDLRLSGEPHRRRLFIDTDFAVFDDAGGKLEGSELARLESLIMLVIGDIRRDATGLRIRFDNRTSITISNEANAKTIRDVWWLSEPL